MSRLHVTDLPEFDDHRIVTELFDKTAGVHGFIVIHRGGLRRPAFGATRLWTYRSDTEALKDALKLSRTMTYKSALAGLTYGGAKAVLMQNAGQLNKGTLLKTYALMVNYLDGHFITGADVGIVPGDLRVMSRYTTCMVGRFVDPVSYTMLGVLYGIRVAVKEVFGSESLTRRTFAIQGVGKTGTGLLRHIYKEARQIYVSDVNTQALEKVKKIFPNVIVVSPTDIFRQKVDVFSPCALSGVINSQSIKTLNVSIIAGSANCQLEHDDTGNQLHKRDILYIPDYVINAGGLISVVDEYEHKKPDDARIKTKVRQIAHTIRTILKHSKKTGKSTNHIADGMAQKIAKAFV